MSDEENAAIIDRIGKALHASINQTLRPLLNEQDTDERRLHALRGAHQVVAHHVGLLEALIAEILDRYGNSHDLMVAEREECMQSGQEHGAHHLAGFCERCGN